MAIVFELAQESLRQFAKRHDGDLIPLEVMLPIAGHIVSGLAHMHVKQVLHRDLHQSNVLLMHGDSMRAVICDFGMSAHVGHDAYTPGLLSANISAAWSRAPAFSLWGL